MPADWYCIWSVYLDSSASAIWLDSLDNSGVALRFCSDTYPTATNYYGFKTAKSSLATGWNHCQVILSSAEKIGSPDWGDIKYVEAECWKPSGSHSVQFTFDNIQLVHKDPDEAAINPFQVEGPHGTWKKVWDIYGNPNVWIVEESDVISVMSADGTSSLLRLFNRYGNATAKYGDFEASGITKIGTSGQATLFYTIGGYHARTNSTMLRLQDSTASYHNVSMSFAEGDLVHWRYKRKGTSHSVSASNDGGLTWKTVSTFCKAGTTVIYKYIYDNQRDYSLAIGSVEYAARAGVADRLESFFFKEDTLFFNRGDSLIYYTRDGARK